FIGIKIADPTRVGNYFAPAYATHHEARIEPATAREHLKRISVESRQGPLLVPQKVFEWKLVYDPAGNAGAGLLEATLGKESVSLALKSGDKAVGALFDRFGIFTSHIGGSYVRVYFDDLAYTTAL